MAGEILVVDDEDDIRSLIADILEDEGYRCHTASDSEGALALCEREGDAWSDSCRLGVSAHAKRLDPARALALCAGVERADLRQRCEAFARR